VILKIILFVMVFSALQLAWQASTDSSIARAFIEKAIVAPAAYTINRVTPDAHAYAAGSRLRSPGGGINIVNGCDGMEMLFLLMAGFAAAPLGGRDRLLGILAGIPLIYLLNQARILALFYSHRSNPELFDALHGFIAPVVMVLLIAAYFYLWLFRTQPVNVAST
jgi:exosortase family protein XrtM